MFGGLSGFLFLVVSVSFSPENSERDGGQESRDLPRGKMEAYQILKQQKRMVSTRVQAKVIVMNMICTIWLDCHEHFAFS